jgi:hypothetical protein
MSKITAAGTQVRKKLFLDEFVRPTEQYVYKLEEREALPTRNLPP